MLVSRDLRSLLWARSSKMASNDRIGREPNKQLPVSRGQLIGRMCCTKNFTVGLPVDTGTTPVVHAGNKL